MSDYRKKRIQMDVTESTYLRIMTIKEETEAASYAEVIRNALKIYEAHLKSGRGVEGGAGNNLSGTAPGMYGHNPNRTT